MSEPRVLYNQASFIRDQICTDEDAQHNARMLQVLLDILGKPALHDGRAAPPTGSDITTLVGLRLALFQLTGTFSGGYADAVTIGYDGAATSETTRVYDVLSKNADAAIGDKGFGFLQENPDGTYSLMAVQVFSSGAENDRLVAVQADDVAGFLDDKMVAGSNITINVTGSAGARTLTVSASGAAVGTDELVKVNALEATAGYLEDQLSDTAGSIPSGKQRVEFETISDDVIIAYTDAPVYPPDLDEKVKVNGVETTAAYLDDQFTNTLGSIPTGNQRVFYGIHDNDYVFFYTAEGSTDLTGGCGISIAGGVASIDRADLTGLGLKAGAGEGCKIDVDADTCQFQFTENALTARLGHALDCSEACSGIYVVAGALAGDGLTAGPPTSGPSTCDVLHVSDPYINNLILNWINVNLNAYLDAYVAANGVDVDVVTGCQSLAITGGELVLTLTKKTVKVLPTPADISPDVCSVAGFSCSG